MEVTFSRENLISRLKELQNQLKDNKSFEAFVHNLSIEFCKISLKHGETTYIQVYVQKMIRNYSIEKYFKNFDPTPKSMKLLMNFFEYVNEQVKY